MTREWHYIGPEGSHARPAVRFAADLPEQTRLALLDEMRAVGHKRTRKTRGQSLDRAGASVLVARPEAPAKRPWFVRLYFVSMAGEQLCTEFGGLTEPEARAIAAGRDSEVWASKRPRDQRCPGLDENDALAAHYPQNIGECAATTWCTCGGFGWVEAPAPAPREGVRVVVFPSEIPNGVEQL